MKNEVVGSTQSAAEDERVSDRREFLGKIGKTAVAAATVGAIGARPFLGGKDSTAAAAIMPYKSGPRSDAAYRYRVDMANANHIYVRPQAANGEPAPYAAYSGLYSKGLLHDALGVPNHASMLSLINAFTTGSHADFNNIIV